MTEINYQALLEKKRTQGINALSTSEKQALSEYGKQTHSDKEEIINAGLEAAKSLANAKKRKLQNTAGRFEALKRKGNAILNLEGGNVYLSAIMVNVGPNGKKMPTAAELTKYILKGIQAEMGISEQEVVVMVQDGEEVKEYNAGKAKFNETMIALAKSGDSLATAKKKKLLKDEKGVLEDFSLAAGKFMPELEKRHLSE